jgi:hypothetical protein
MQILVKLTKPVLFSFFTSVTVKRLVIELLYKYSKTTDNKVDDTLVKLVEDALFTAP